MGVSRRGLLIRTIINNFTAAATIKTIKYLTPFNALPWRLNTRRIRKLQKQTRRTLVHTVMLVPQKIGGSRKDARTGCTKSWSGMGAADRGVGDGCCTNREVMKQKCEERSEYIYELVDCVEGQLWLHDDAGELYGM